MAIENESNQMLRFFSLSNLLLQNQGGKDLKNQSFTTTHEGFLEKFRIHNIILFRNGMDSVLYIREEGNENEIKKERRTHILLSPRSRVK